MARVKCRVCENSDGKKCLVKKVKVAQNKSRTCELFDYNPGKIKIKQKLKSNYIPWHLRDKTAYKEYAKEQEQQTSAMQGVKVSSPDVLSRFRSSATQEDA